MVAKRLLPVPGRPSFADFDLLGQKPQEDANPDRQEPTLPKIDSVEFVDVAGVELLKNRDKPICDNIVTNYKKGQSNKSDTAHGKRPQRIAIAHLNIAGGRYCSQHAFVHQWPALCHSGVAKAKTIMLRQLVRHFRNAVSSEIAEPPIIIRAAPSLRAMS
jgi:hypothetical protein